MLVAYSMLQMVREQALLECMSGDAILMVRVPLARSPASLEPDPCTHLTKEYRPILVYGSFCLQRRAGDKRKYGTPC